MAGGNLCDVNTDAPTRDCVSIRWATVRMCVHVGNCSSDKLILVKILSHSGAPEGQPGRKLLSTAFLTLCLDVKKS